MASSAGAPPARRCTAARAGAPARRRSRLLSLAAAAALSLALAPAASALAPFTCPAADAPAPMACYVGWSGTYFQFGPDSNGAPVAAVTTFATPGLCVRRRWVCTAAANSLVTMLNGINATGYAPPIPVCVVGSRQTVYSFVNTSWCAQKQAWLVDTAAHVDTVPMGNVSVEAIYWHAQRVIADAVESYTFCDTPLCNTPDDGAGGTASGAAAWGAGVWGGAAGAARAAAPLLLAAAALLGGGGA
jgi:hypothetical protein